MFIAYVYVCRHIYIFCFAFTCLHAFFVIGLNRLGVNMHTWARAQVDRIDTDIDDVEEHTYGKGRCIQKWTFFLWAPRSQWSHQWWAMVPTHIQIPTTSTNYWPADGRFNYWMTNPREYSSYRLLIRFHLRRITVVRWSSINNRDNWDRQHDTEGMEAQWAKEGKKNWYPKKNQALAWCLKHLWLVRATQWADFAVIGDQLWSTMTEIFWCVALDRKSVV